MANRFVHLDRKTKETTISLDLDMDQKGPQNLQCGLPFFEHMLNAMAFHGNFLLTVKATGDLEVDPHHLVEDLGLVLGQALLETQEKGPALSRYGHSIIPMDDALSEAVIDACRRPYLVYKADFPQAYAGNFDLSLAREFFLALSNKAQINLHLECRYGLNSHHMLESLFKALGKALKAAYIPAPDNAPLSTKGLL